ncbi:MFS transporter [Streptomyces sp. NBC_00063]|uniref:MFS transporter n=1 Tax=Streptomyces sp. NBC_00063 TaxID=2975638 RepID=UPI003D75FB06
MTGTSERASKRRLGQYGPVAISFFIMFVEGYDLISLGAVGPTLLHYGPWSLSHDDIGLVGTVTSLGMPLGALAAGWAGDRWGRRRPLAIVLVWISLTMLIAATAPAFWLFLLARLGTGAAVGALGPLVAAYVSEAAPRRHRSLHISIAFGAIGVGGVAAAVLARSLLPGASFRWMFAVGVIPVVVAPLLWRMRPAAVPAGEAEPAVPSAGQRSQSGGRLGGVLSGDLRRGTLLLSVGAFMGLLLIFSTSTWLPTIMVNHGFNLRTSLDLTIAFNVGASLGAALAAMVADRGYLRAVTTGCFALCAVTMIFLSMAQGKYVLVAISVFAGLGALGAQNMVISCIASHFPTDLRGTGLGVCMGAGRFGAILGPAYVAWVVGLFASTRAGFYAFVVPAVLGALAIMFLPRRTPAVVTLPQATEASPG